MFLFLFKWYIHFFFFKYEKVTMAGLASSDICQQNHAFKILMKLVKIISTVAVDDDIDDVCRFRFSQLTTASPRGPLTREHLRRLRLFASNICLWGETSNNFNLRRSIKRPFCSKTLSLLFKHFELGEVSSFNHCLRKENEFMLGTPTQCPQN